MVGMSAMKLLQWVIELHVEQRSSVRPGMVPSVVQGVLSSVRHTPWVRESTNGAPEMTKQFKYQTTVDLSVLGLRGLT
jgi:hypothetical protein